MRWQVEKDGRKITYNPSTLIQLLLGRIVNAKDNSAINHLTTQLIDSLGKSGGLGTTSIYGLAHMAITIGYYYRVFLERNNITIEEDNESTASKEPSNESSDQ